MSPEELYRITVLSFHEDGDKPEVRQAHLLRSFVPTFRCSCDNLDCRLQRVLALEKELNNG